jgi:intergrase/recombinase
MAGPPGIEPRNFLRQEVSSRNENIEDTLKRYYAFCTVNRGMQPRVAKDYREYAARFLKSSKGVISEETVRQYLTIFLSKKPKTYNNQLEGLRSFVGRFLNRMDIMERFKRVWQPTSYERQLPTKQQIRKGFEALEREDEKALYLLYATSGIRKSEALKLCEDDVDRALRCVKPKHDTRTKKAGVSFFNDECAYYINKVSPGNPRIFHMKTDRFDMIWHKATEKAGIKITPQVLRVWQSTELGEHGIPDRYVDVFQGRAPKSMIARFYTGKELLRLKRIYEKADLKVLGW